MSEHAFKHGDRGVTPTGFPVVYWVSFDSGHDYSAWRFLEGREVPKGTQVRPLVVIDPENADDVARLHNLVMGSRDPDADRDDLGYEDTAEALREFANPRPPKPAEPTGRCAVVIDDHGVSWVRTYPTPNHQWANSDGVGTTWSDIPITSPDQIKFAGVEQ